MVICLVSGTRLLGLSPPSPASYQMCDLTSVSPFANWGYKTYLITTGSESVKCCNSEASESSPWPELEQFQPQNTVTLDYSC